MNILILHSMGNPSRWLQSVATFELGLQNFDESHNYLVHNTSLPLPRFVKEFRFDIIIMNSSFLTSVFDIHRLNKLRDQYGFIKNSEAFKVALPQDDYYCSQELDNLVTEWKINLLYTVCPKHWDLLYPNFSSTNGKILLGYTGYITPELIEQSQSPKLRSLRSRDLSYRASGQPSFPNKLASLKAQIGEIFMENFSQETLNLDISSSTKSFISGSAWWDFIEDSKCVLGSMSGSSNLIRNHKIVEDIRVYQRKNPNAIDDEIIASCLPPEDTSNVYEAISPRVIEAAMLNSVQILVKGDYSEIIKPYYDYMPILGDFLNGDRKINNKEEISELMYSQPLQEELSASCRETLLSFDRLRIGHFFQEIFDQFESWKVSGSTGDSFSFSKMKVKYDLLMTPLYKMKFQAGNYFRIIRKLIN